MTIFNIRTAAIMELPLSNVNGNADDLVNSSNKNIDDAEHQTINANKRLSRYEYKDKKKNIKKYKKSKTYKLTNFYSTPEISTYRIKEKIKLDENKHKQKVKNVFGQSILEDVKVTIGGHKGMIKVNEKYIANWIYVNTLNEFSFYNHSFLIDSELTQYKIDDDNQCEMEKVLCYYLPERDEYRFYDENINEITNYVRVLFKNN